MLRLNTRSTCGTLRVDDTPSVLPTPQHAHVSFRPRALCFFAHTSSVVAACDALRCRVMTRDVPAVTYPRAPPTKDSGCCAHRGLNNRRFGHTYALHGASGETERDRGGEKQRGPLNHSCGFLEAFSRARTLHATKYGGKTPTHQIRIRCCGKRRVNQRERSERFPATGSFTSVLAEAVLGWAEGC